ncbi:hypothetical protein BSL78_21922 [Apostichopus japonicus]|uniref:Ig-like domain-containing protein n=1 Tax=Stichopus japonicus TaxID=307972 RepID=A0A2G8JZT7_STIJA|nr:hypothetical protein BSL78_21922 [Apostichopus japonicus]
MCWCILNGTVVALDKCPSPQYLQLGKKGVISCNYPGGFYGAFWYKSNKLTSNDRSFISLREGMIIGPGHDSGEYGVLPDGSLMINQVSTQHNHVFAVSTLATTDDDPIVEYVHIVVYDKPREPYPTIDATGCDQKSLCFLELNAASSLKCSVLRVGAVLDDLSWKLRTSSGDEQISSQSIPVNTSVNELQSYHTVVDISLQTSLSLRLFVCAARSNVSETVVDASLDNSRPGLSNLDSPARDAVRCEITAAYYTQMSNSVYFFSVAENNSKDRQGTTASTQQQQQQQPLKPTIKVTEEELKARCKKVIISKDQHRDEHDGIVKRLKEASERQVDIQRIILQDSFTSVEDNDVALNLSSGAVLPPLNTLNRLSFENEKWQRWDLTKLISILQYACHRSPPTDIE